MYRAVLVFLGYLALNGPWVYKVFLPCIWGILVHVLDFLSPPCHVVMAAFVPCSEQRHFLVCRLVSVVGQDWIFWVRSLGCSCTTLTFSGSSSKS